MKPTSLRDEAETAAILLRIRTQEQTNLNLADMSARSSNQRSFDRRPERHHEMADQVSKDLLDSKLEAARAQTDLEFIKVMAALDRKPSTWVLVTSVFGAAATILGVILTVLAFGGDRFDGGIAASGLVRDIQVQQQQRDDAQDQKLDAILNRLDALVAQAPTRAPQKNATPGE